MGALFGGGPKVQGAAGKDDPSVRQARQKALSAAQRNEGQGYQSTLLTREEDEKDKRPGVQNPAAVKRTRLGGL